MRQFLHLRKSIWSLSKVPLCRIHVSRHHNKDCSMWDQEAFSTHGIHSTSHVAQHEWIPPGLLYYGKDHPLWCGYCTLPPEDVIHNV